MVKVIKLNGVTFVDGSNKSIEFFKIIQSEISYAPVDSFILDYEDQKTSAEKIQDSILNDDPDIIKNFIYLEEQINKADCSVTKFLKQLKREFKIESLIFNEHN